MSLTNSDWEAGQSPEPRGPIATLSEIPDMYMISCHFLHFSFFTTTQDLENDNLQESNISILRESVPIGTILLGAVCLPQKLNIGCDWDQAPFSQ